MSQIDRFVETEAVLTPEFFATLFAPTDAAFVTLLNQFNLTEEELLNLPEFPDVLRFHLMAGKLLTSDFSDSMTLTTLLGKDVRANISGSSVRINGANLIATDVETSNGVIHVIDAVIVPPADSTNYIDCWAKPEPKFTKTHQEPFCLNVSS